MPRGIPVTMKDRNIPENSAWYTSATRKFQLVIRMNTLYRTAKYLKSVHYLKDLPEYEGREVAFAGRSNAGKSSAINTVTDQKGLAHTSKTPGRTQQINFFQLTPDRFLVDLPGYGFAKVPAEIKRHWQQALDDYLRTRDKLEGLVLVMDIRHPLTEFDQQMLFWCAEAELPVHLLLTKADKLKRGQQASQLLQVKSWLATEIPNAITSAQTFSALKKQGVDEIHRVLDTWLVEEKDEDEDEDEE